MTTKRGVLKWIYAAAMLNMVVLACWGAIFEIPGMITFFWPSTVQKTDMLFGGEGFLLIGFLIVAAPLVFLIRRPMWWGKLLLPIYGLSWLSHAAVLPIILSGFEPRVFEPRIFGPWVPIVCGFMMFVLAFAHQAIDPGFFRRVSTVPDA